MPRRQKKQPIGGYLLNGIISLIVYLVFYVLIAAFLSGVVALAYQAGYMNSNTYSFVIYAVTLLSLSFAVFAYLRFYKSVRAIKIPTAINASLAKLTLRNILIGLILFIIILAIELLISVISLATNTTINTNVSQLFTGAPLWFYFFAAVIEPINEEIMFRGFMVPRIGIVLSAIIFGSAHYTYNSTFGVEVILAFIFGIIAGYAYKKTGSIYPGIVAHILVNSLAALSILSYSAVI